MAVDLQLSLEKEDYRDQLNQAVAEADSTEDNPREQVAADNKGAGKTGRRPGETAGTPSTDEFSLEQQSEESLANKVAREQNAATAKSVNYLD